MADGQPTIRDVARLAQVSEATVSRALRGLRHVSADTEAAVRRAADQLGFSPSRSAAALATGRARAVSVVTPNLVSWFYACVLEGVDRTLRADGYGVALVSLAEGEGARRRLTARDLRAGQAPAHLVIGFELDAAEQAVLRASAAPVVTVGCRVEGVRGIGIPEEQAARLVVQHLVDQGHRRIGHIGADREDGWNPVVAEARRAAWHEVLTDAGIEPLPSWFGRGEFRVDSSRAAALRVLSAPDRPTAIFAASDVSAFGVLLAAQELGLRVPQDVAVAGIDDHPFSAAYGLTTVRQSPAEQGARAAALLLHDLGGHRHPVPVEPEPFELVVRASTSVL